MECGAWSGGCPNSPAGGRSCRFRGCLGLLPGLVDHGWGEVAKRLVGSPRVVALEPFRQPIAQGVHGGVLEEIDLLVFHAPPQPLRGEQGRAEDQADGGEGEAGACEWRLILSPAIAALSPPQNRYRARRRPGQAS